jgi:DNA-binding FadR family transcriptional regulator
VKERYNVNKTSQSKVYQDVLEELRGHIRKEKLCAGDKLPSERELAEKLDAGRSSIREALRALELLGLIETRRGEGTFLRTYQSLQSVELLSSFILLQDGTRNDLLKVKQLIEKEAAKLAIPHLTHTNFSELKHLVHIEDSIERHQKFFTFLLEKIDNQLLLKIWILLEEFAESIGGESYSSEFYHDLLKEMENKDACSIELLYEKKGL